MTDKEFDSFIDKYNMVCEENTKIGDEILLADKHGTWDTKSEVILKKWRKFYKDVFSVIQSWIDQDSFLDLFKDFKKKTFEEQKEIIYKAIEKVGSENFKEFYNVFFDAESTNAMSMKLLVICPYTIFVVRGGLDPLDQESVEIPEKFKEEYKNVKKQSNKMWKVVNAREKQLKKVKKMCYKWYKKEIKAGNIVEGVD